MIWGIAMISAEDVAAYRRDGFLVVENVLDQAQLAEARRVVAEFIEKAGAVSTHTDVYDLEPGHQPGAPRVRRIKTPHKHHPFFWELAKSPRLLAILQSLLGPGVRLHGSKINLKAPHFGSPVEWHQDWAFYPHTNDDILAVGVMLDDCTVENGAMLVLPDTHRGPVYDHHADGFFCGAMDPAACDLDFAKAAPVTGKAGSMSFHHVRAVHGSAQNRSDKPRALLLYEFAATDAWPLAGVKDLAEFDGRIVAGAPTIVPRLADVPVRLPLPPAPHQGSIYENQTTAKNRYFAGPKSAVA
jgi:ectoine hydroxylase-related dioxygenase (phytanoyl-CoA dioxygenase family)